MMVVLALSMAVSVNADTEPPTDYRLPEEMQCSADRELVIRDNGMFACVKHATAQRMQELGIALPVPITDLLAVSGSAAENTSVYMPSVDTDAKDPKTETVNNVLLEALQCNANRELVIRDNGMFACVKHATAQRMQELGIALPVPITDLLAASGSAAEKATVVESVADRTIIEEDIVVDRTHTTKSQKSAIQTIPASGMSVIHFYIFDHDLNLAHSGVEVVDTKGLVEFTINDIPFEGPKTMRETGPNTGHFHLEIKLPESINGKPLSRDDIVVIRYLDKSDYTGHEKTAAESLSLTSTFAKIEVSGKGSSRIGHDFTVRVYEPDANRNSGNEDKIPLNVLEFRTQGGIKTTLANPEFDANSRHLIETGPNTGIFEVQVKMPRNIDGTTIHIGHTYEIRYIDKSNPADTDQKIVVKGKIGL